MKSAARFLIAIVAALGLVVGTTTLARASIPSGNNTITACRTSNGNVRIIDTDAGQTCVTGETRISWGGGMRYRGVWTTVTPPYTQSDPVKKGDVIYYNGAVGQFGCTSPHGSWVNVNGVHSYPCLEFPSNWAPLALDGKNADVHWVKTNSSGGVISASDPGTQTGVNPYLYVVIPGIPDASKCAVTATTNTWGARVVIYTKTTAGSGVITLAAADPVTGAFRAVALDITVACGKY